VIVRCFEGRSMPEVMERVRQELGDDAVILHTQQRRSWWAWLRRLPTVRVWAALSTTAGKERWATETAANCRGAWPCAPTRKETAANYKGAQPCAPTQSLPLTEAAGRMERQLQLLTALLWQREGALANMGALSALWQCGVDLETLQALGMDAVPPEGVDLHQWLHDVLRVRLKVTDGIAPTTKVAVLVGPTGVGKTTTVAKIAANEWIRRHRRVALVTVDVFRIGAVQQLETYARLMGLPFFVATMPEEAERCVQQAQRVADLVLVDTIGRSPKHDEQLSALWDLVAAMSPDEVHLTLPANGNPADLKLAAERFSLFCPTHLIITKLDEATQPGVMVNLSHRLNLPIAYLTVGQSVPDDLEIPTPDRLAFWVLSPLRSGCSSAEVKGDA
jgi:flagellar biosynthesis protein FlhF